MRKFIFTGLIGLLSLSSMAQGAGYALSEPVKNAPDSEYRFTKIAKLDATPVESQGQAGTCWSFSALSFFESEMMRQGVKNPDLLSKMYIVRKAYEAKAEKYIRMDGSISFSQGGAFHDIPYVIKRYGIVPEEIYKGLNYGKDTHDHNEFFAALESVVTAFSKVKGTLSPAWKSAVTAILDAYLGPDVTEFTWKGKKYTPKSYAESTGLKMDDYISLTSFTNYPLNGKCIIEVQDNWAWGESYNIGMQDLFDVAEYALKNGYTIAWAADVSEKGFSFSNGLGIVPEDPNTIQVKGKDNSHFSDGGAERISNAFKTPVKELTITQELRQAGYEDKSTTDDHGMHIVGLYKDQKGTKYFLVKNSWGTGNYPQGFLYVSENYYKYKTMNIYLHKDGIQKDLKKKLGIN